MTDEKKQDMPEPTELMAKVRVLTLKEVTALLTCHECGGVKWHKPDCSFVQNIRGAR